MTAAWELAGRAWSEHATDFAYLYEPLARPLYQVVFDKTAVDVGTRLLDVGCASGFAAMMAAERGAIVAGLDASAGLLDVARARVPAGDFRIGDMSELPFADATFDVVVTFTGIVAGLDQAMAEAARVLRPGGTLALASWGSPRRRGHLAYFMTLVDILPPEEIEHDMAMMATGRPGVAENLLTGAGLEVLERGHLDLTSEFPDVPTAVRAFSAGGPSWAAIQQVGTAKFTEVLTSALSAVADDTLGVRLSSEFFWLTGRKPG